MSGKLGPVLVSVGMLGLVGGVAAVQLFQPAAKPAQVRMVQPAGQTVTVTPSASPTVAATATPKVAATTVAPVKPVKVAVNSTPKATTSSVAPRTVQRQAIVSQTPTDPTPQPTSPSQLQPVKPPGPGVKLDTGTPPPTTP